jgi:hypothetical protein
MNLNALASPLRSMAITALVSNAKLLEPWLARMTTIGTCSEFMGLRSHFAAVR